MVMAVMAATTTMTTTMMMTTMTTAMVMMVMMVAATMVMAVMAAMTTMTTTMMMMTTTVLMMAVIMIMITASAPSLSVIRSKSPSSAFLLLPRSCSFTLETAQSLSHTGGREAKRSGMTGSLKNNSASSSRILTRLPYGAGHCRGSDSEDAAEPHPKRRRTSLRSNLLSAKAPPLDSARARRVAEAADRKAAAARNEAAAQAEAEAALEQLGCSDEQELIAIAKALSLSDGVAAAPAAHISTHGVPAEGAPTANTHTQFSDSDDDDSDGSSGGGGGGHAANTHTRFPRQ